MKERKKETQPPSDTGCEINDMTPERITDKVTIERFLRGNPSLHVYSLGDLDEFFWPYTTWHGLIRSGAVRALFLLYKGTDLPVLLALEEHDLESAGVLLKGLFPQLPRRFYSHLSPSLVPLILPSFTAEHHGLHRKMSLHSRAALRSCILTTYDARPLMARDLPQIRELYGRSYEGNWFDSRMLDTGKYFGAFHKSQLVAISGVHVFSRKYRVAALGNITTDPAYRGKGIGASITATLCQELCKDVELIGLNVKADNEAAIRCYEKIGFAVDSSYEEHLFTRHLV